MSQCAPIMLKTYRNLLLLNTTRKANFTLCLSLAHYNQPCPSQLKLRTAPSETRQIRFFTTGTPKYSFIHAMVATPRMTTSLVCAIVAELGVLAFKYGARSRWRLYKLGFLRVTNQRSMRINDLRRASSILPLTKLSRCFELGVYRGLSMSIFLQTLS